MANEKGTYSNPYTYEEFEDLLNEGNWNGGHVIYEGVTYYYNHDGIQGSDGCDGCNGCGEGSGCGCGCGCGCGEGCGCGCGCGCGEGCGCGCGGLIAGTESIRPSGMPADREIVITWQGGYFTSTTGPSVSAVMKDVSSGQETSAMACWESAFRVRIEARMRILIGGEYRLFEQAIYYEIPQHYRI